MNELYDLPDLDDIDYMGDTVSPLQAKAGDVSESFGFTEEMMTKFLHRLYEGKFDPKQEIDPDMWEQVRTVLREAVAKGYDEPNMPDTDEAFYEQLQHNTDVFSAFKVHRMQNDMARMLVDSNGKLKTFEQWSNDVQTISSHQVGRWLQTEYDTAVIRAHQAADWQQFEREKDVLPNLKWMPSTSAHPGADHRVFWGTVRPISDPFWSSHRPGDRWNCKCSLSSTDEPVTQIPDATSSDMPQNGLENNPGTDAKAFSDSHPYFPANCTSCDFYKGSKEGFTNRMKNCYNCKYANKTMERCGKFKLSPKEDYRDLSRDPQWKEVLFDKKTGGIKATHLGHNLGNEKQTYFGSERLTGADLENEVTNQLFHSGHKVKLCDEQKRAANGNFLSALDLEYDGKMMDIRSITGKGLYSNAMISKHQQLWKYNNREDVDTKADSLMLYFHDPSMFNEEKMRISIGRYLFRWHKNGTPVKPIIKNVYVVLKGDNDVRHYTL
jgi:hypothetical protein